MLSIIFWTLFLFLLIIVLVGLPLAFAVGLVFLTIWLLIHHTLWGIILLIVLVLGYVF